MEHYVGQRCSYQGERCTVRFVGGIANKSGQWLGVEWDDPTKGRHDGTYEGTTYFACKHPSRTAGSFIRPSRPQDPANGLVEAMEIKYVSSSKGLTRDVEIIEISGKTVEEVGFEKIERQLAGLTELKIVVLDSLRIRGITGVPMSFAKHEAITSDVQQPLSWLRQTKIEELDLSRNLFEHWDEIYLVSQSIPRLQILKLAGNRFCGLRTSELEPTYKHDDQLKGLHLDDTLLDFNTISIIASLYPNLATLTASYNLISSLTSAPSTPRLRHLDLSFNRISNLLCLAPLASLPELKSLSLRSNPLTTLNTTQPLIFPTITHLDISSTFLPSLPSLNSIPSIFPKLSSLLTQHTPLSALSSASLLTIARLGTIREFNYSSVSMAERQNAELYYMSTIVQQLSDAESLEQERDFLTEHSRWHELCELHGKPTVQRKYGQAKGKEEVYPPGTLGSRVAKFVFIMASHVDEGKVSGEKQGEEGVKRRIARTRIVPIAISTYQLLGLVAEMFGMPFMDVRLVLETEEFDFLGDEADGDGSEDIGDFVDETAAKSKGRKPQNEWVRREEEMVGSTKPVGDWLPVGFVGSPNKEVNIRVEEVKR
ncbi:uncharacterized protein KY384_002075 [Bacidia gigantensis]|uniref:uncharacterized protein n=1 Tax=Bacidia gigantensis TaxID=2732470 RepID=UPI001D046889|nr:uncharacterized protein KY384_002075 [Bacidia gigantensis]KAG8533292.1 hypothetical protein KY384_002075 [Bacidia gigantensis]